ncbi:MAG: hydantoinase B/oxoprolinase family protein [Planctomycetes bacterium]|nr:hydantoinase B/oxoprolinase family protein [Planctomycetota bacterium]MBI3832834.1 hydantoinase B/oxoprolinase family protein [Planctomycetota bacterium]
MPWRFAIDVGGTFTDVVARTPDGAVVTCKLLSSGAVRGVCDAGSTPDCIADHRRSGESPRLWDAYTLHLLDDDGSAGQDFKSTRDAGACGSVEALIKRHDASTGRLHLDKQLPFRTLIGRSYELRSHEEAPVVAIRQVMGMRLNDVIGPIEVRLGTTRATNALLERKGSRVAFVTTKGFGDVLRIGYQDRPALFNLNIRKRDELYECSVEIDERLDFAGHVLRSPNLTDIRSQLQELLSRGIEALAICFLHAHVNPIHEEQVAAIAEETGFRQVSVSSRISRLERIVPRGDTTVVDAYLSGVIRGYVESLRRSMPKAKIRLMASAGGLMEASLASGKDTILSGPAGGVVGCAQISRAAGFDRVIGFDMGGTSTDVSRVEPPPNSFQYENETVKAGVRIMRPMLGVETVAAGGGSTCFFDGLHLCVGPKSAGADPGPACYGRGGPLTITDMNLYIGRLAAEHFPFPLDRDVVDQKLRDLTAQLRGATGSTLSPKELAEGFIRIANDHMAAAIKRISVAKGYDVREYALCTFGGAGGQHACAIARSLGMTRILCSPYAGVLSAFGIGAAEVKRFGQQSAQLPLDADGLKEAETIFERLESHTRAELVREGNDANNIRSIRSIDLCYAGQSSTLTVQFGDAQKMAREFANAHERCYGYRHGHRAIEIRAIRVESVAIAKSIESCSAAHHVTTKGRQSIEDQSAFVPNRASVDAPPVYDRSDLDFAEYIRGPAVIVEEHSTIFVECGWKAQIVASGDILLTDRGAGRTLDAASSLATSRSATINPIQLELFRNHFAAIAEQMGETLRRTALSTNVKERLDFSCAIFDTDGNLVVNAPHIPVHLGGMSECVRCLMADVGEFRRGDVYVTNDPYRGGSHLNDVTIITPIHDRGGDKLIFFVANRAHHAEIGGTRPGSMPPNSTCLAEEGVVIRAFRYVADGDVQADALRSILSNAPYPSRNPDDNMADIDAQVAANQTGVRELLATVDRHGLHFVTTYIEAIQASAERKMRAAIRNLQQGERQFEDRLDDGTPIRLRIDIHGDHAVLDFTGTGPVHPGNFNANRAIVFSAVLYCFRCLIVDDIPLNSGVLAPITILLPECFLNPSRNDDPRRCPAVAAGNVETSQRIVDTIFGALGIMAASQGTMNNLLIGNERFGYYETICGGAGAGPGFHGADAVHTHMTNTRLTDPEVLESRYPLRLYRFQIRPDSGGDGLFHGGCGVLRELEFLEPLEVSIISQRRLTSPYGVGGGLAGASGKNLLIGSTGGSVQELPPTATFRASKGDRLIIETPGGGGWGNSSL